MKTTVIVLNAFFRRFKLQLHWESFWNEMSQMVFVIMAGIGYMGLS